MNVVLLRLSFVSIALWAVVGVKPRTVFIPLIGRVLTVGRGKVLSVCTSVSLTWCRVGVLTLFARDTVNVTCCVSLGLSSVNILDVCVIGRCENTIVVTLIVLDWVSLVSRGGGSVVTWL